MECVGLFAKINWHLIAWQMILVSLKDGSFALVWEQLTVVFPVCMLNYSASLFIKQLLLYSQLN